MSEPDYITRHFAGVVQLRERWENPTTGVWYTVIAGTVTIMEDAKLVGFKTRSTDSNWIARVEGPSGMSVNILGCKVHSVTAWRNGLPAIDSAVAPDIFVVP